MNKILILGAGTAGTIMANKLHHTLPHDEWQITIVDQDETHIYQPGLLFIPFNMYTRNDVIKPKRDFIPQGVELIMSPIDVIEPEQNRVKLTNNQMLGYDYLIIATGTRTEPEETEGLSAMVGTRTSLIFILLPARLACKNSSNIGVMVDSF